MGKTCIDCHKGIAHKLPGQCVKSSHVYNSGLLRGYAEARVTLERDERTLFSGLSFTDRRKRVYNTYRSNSAGKTTLLAFNDGVLSR